MHPIPIQQYYKSTCSTNSKGDAQPGNLLLKVTDERRELREETRTRQVSKDQKRVADYIRRNKRYSIVDEIKSDETDA